MKDVKTTPNGHSGGGGLSGLQSEKSIERLEQISSLRARGISKNIDLPQLVVGGDQSAGKSSVLEGISNIPFPRADGVCTKVSDENTFLVICLLTNVLDSFRPKSYLSIPTTKSLSPPLSFRIHPALMKPRRLYRHSTLASPATTSSRMSLAPRVS